MTVLIYHMVYLLYVMFSYRNYWNPTTSNLPISPSQGRHSAIIKGIVRDPRTNFPVIPQITPTLAIIITN